MADSESLPAAFQLFLKIYEQKGQSSSTRKRTTRHLKICSQWLNERGLKPEDINRKTLQDLYAYSKAFFSRAGESERLIANTRNAIAWLIENGHLTGRVQDVTHFRRTSNKWDPELPKIAREYISSMEGKVKTSTVRLHRHALRVFYTFLKEAKTPIEKVGPTEMSAFLRFLHQSELGQMTRANTYFTIKTYLSWLYLEKKIPKNPREFFQRGDGPRPPDYLPRPLEPDVDRLVQKFLFQQKHSLAHQGALLLRWTGIRIGELVSLEFNCIHRDAEDNPFLKVPLGKLNNERLVPLDAEAVKLIERIQKISIQNARRGLKSTPPDTLLVRPTTGEPCSHSDLRLIPGEICSELKLQKHFTIHQFRHTYATSLLTAGLSIVALKELLGHRTIFMTLKYAKVTQVKLREDYYRAVRSMGGRYHFLHTPPQQGSESSLDEMILDLTRMIQKNAGELGSSRSSRIVKRLQRIREDLR